MADVQLPQQSDVLLSRWGVGGYGAGSPGNQVGTKGEVGVVEPLGQGPLLSVAEWVGRPCLLV